MESVKKSFLKSLISFLKNEKSIKMNKKLIKTLEEESKKPMEERAVDCVVEEENVLNSVPKVKFFNIVFYSFKVIKDKSFSYPVHIKKNNLFDFLENISNLKNYTRETKKALEKNFSDFVKKRLERENTDTLYQRKVFFTFYENDTFNRTATSTINYADKYQKILDLWYYGYKEFYEWNIDFFNFYVLSREINGEEKKIWEYLTLNSFFQKRNDFSEKLKVIEKIFTSKDFYFLFDLAVKYRFLFKIDAEKYEKIRDLYINMNDYDKEKSIKEHYIKKGFLYLDNKYREYLIESIKKLYYPYFETNNPEDELNKREGFNVVVKRIDGIVGKVDDLNIRKNFFSFSFIKDKNEHITKKELIKYLKYIPKQNKNKHKEKIFCGLAKDFEEKDINFDNFSKLEAIGILSTRFLESEIIMFKKKQYEKNINNFHKETIDYFLLKTEIC